MSEYIILRPLQSFYTITTTLYPKVSSLFWDNSYIHIYMICRIVKFTRKSSVNIYSFGCPLEVHLKFLALYVCVIGLYGVFWGVILLELLYNIHIIIYAWLNLHFYRFDNNIIVNIAGKTRFVMEKYCDTFIKIAVFLKKSHNNLQAILFIVIHTYIFIIFSNKFKVLKLSIIILNLIFCLDMYIFIET